MSVLSAASRDGVEVPGCGLDDGLLYPGVGEVESAAALLQRIDDVRGAAKLVGPDGAAVEIPASVLAGLRLVARAIASGRAVTVAPQDMELTSQQAADLLHVSRPHLIKLLDRGELPYYRTSDDPAAHRRITLSDVVGYRTRRRTDRQARLRELSRASQEADGGYR